MNWGAPAIITRGHGALPTSARPCRRRLRAHPIFLGSLGALRTPVEEPRGADVDPLCFKGGWATNAIALMLTAFLTLKKHAGRLMPTFDF